MRHRRAFAPPHSQRLAGVASARVAWLKARLPTPPRQSDAKPATPPVKRGMSKEQARGAAMRARCAAAPLYAVSAGADAVLTLRLSTTRSVARVRRKPSCAKNTSASAAPRRRRVLRHAPARSACVGVPCGLGCTDAFAAPAQATSGNPFLNIILGITVLVGLAYLGGIRP